ncbi:MAG: sulfate adenylyltransferase subunit CysN [Kiritimatiellia bacterium]
MQNTTPPQDLTIVKERDLLRFTTAGSVDDGKSTLIGRMLFDSKQIFQDQMEQLEHSSKLRGEENVNLALLTDGLRAEREQGITIDVAYRYFSTARRKFIIADTPGHEQYTRNMVTGASNADLAIILIDARHGVLPQSRRHGIIASLLAIPHVVVCINKMDLVEYNKERFDEIADEYRQFASKLNIHDITFIPVSALLGDNVVNRSANTPWYQGSPLLQFLEDVTITADRNLVDFRLPVQYVIRPNQDFRGFAGMVASGTIRVGEEIIALPGMQRSTVTGIVRHQQSPSEAREGEAVTLTLADEIDISRGDMIVRRHNIPEIESEFEATVAWMDERLELIPGKEILLRHTTRTTKAIIDEILYRLDVNTLHRSDASSLHLNEIARVRISTAQPLFFDPYDRNRATGGFALIDPNDFRTVGAGMIRHSSRSTLTELKRAQSTHIPLPAPAETLWTPGLVALSDRSHRQKHEPLCLWFLAKDSEKPLQTAALLEKQLFDAGVNVIRLTDDNTAKGINADLRENPFDQQERQRRHLHLARFCYDQGAVVICALQQAPPQEWIDQRFPPEALITVAFDDLADARHASIKIEAHSDPQTCAALLAAQVMPTIRTS